MATTTQPTSTKNPNPSETTSPTPPSKPSPRKSIFSRLHALLLRRILHTIHIADTTIVRLATLLANPASTDALLGTTSYTLALLHALLSRLLAHRLSNALPTPTPKPGSAAPSSASASAPVVNNIIGQVLAATKAVPPVIDDYRIFVRMWGLVGLYMWARGLVQSPLAPTAGAKDRRVRCVVWAEIASLAVFQVLENGAYLASKGALAGAGWSGEEGKRREMRWWMWSSRWWFAFVALELVRLGVQKIPAPESSREVEEKEKGALADGEKEGKLLLEKKRRQDWLWWRDLVSNLAYLPMTLHWSVEEGKSVLSEWMISVLGFVAGGALLVDAWGAAA